MNGLILKTPSNFQSSFGVYTSKVKMVGHEEVFVKTGAVCYRRGAVESIDKGTCIIYSLGPERLTKMSGNKASCYFLTAVQTCIDRNLAPQKKKWDWVADVKPTGHYCLCAQPVACVLQFFLNNIFHCRRSWGFLMSKKTYLLFPQEPFQWNLL